MEIPYKEAKEKILSLLNTFEFEANRGEERAELQEEHGDIVYFLEFTYWLGTYSEDWEPHLISPPETFITHFSIDDINAGYYIYEDEVEIKIDIKNTDIQDYLDFTIRRH